MSDYSPLSPDLRPRTKRTRRDSHTVRMVRAVECFVKATVDQTLTLKKGESLTDAEIRMVIPHRFTEFKKSLVREEEDEDYGSDYSHRT